uniref:Lysophospholipid acyltransferase 7 n=1 Tax=Globodera rostochiensis TaxID=31243 RepID=A0A914I7K8_GLORO
MHVEGPPKSMDSTFFSRAKNDLVYALLLIASALIAAALRLSSSNALRRRVDGLIGLSIAVLVGGWMALCSLITVLAHLALISIIRCPSHLTNLSFFGTFTFLALLRCQHFVGLPRLEFVSNAIQLIMTLRVIGLAYEIADIRRTKEHNEGGTNGDENQTTTTTIPTTDRHEPNAIEAFTYLYSFTGLFTGPYYTYKTYSDAIDRQKPIAWTKLAPLIGQKLQTLCWTVPSLVLMTWLDPLNAIRGRQIDEYSMLSLFFWCAMAFVYMRMRVYSAWMVAESICLVAGIGIYPAAEHNEVGSGPKNEQIPHYQSLDYDDPAVALDAETIRNLDIPCVEHSDGFRSGMRAWNRTVQFWLANFVYRRTNRAYRMPYTMFVSAFWHGIHLGYFLSFLTIPLCTSAEDGLFKAFPERPAWLRHLWSFVRMRGFEMMACGFLLLDGWDTIRLWSKMYFWLHLVMFGTILALKAYKMLR